MLVLAATIVAAFLLHAAMAALVAFLVRMPERCADELAHAEMLVHRKACADAQVHYGQNSCEKAFHW